MRLDTPSLRYTCSRCLLTVAGVTHSSRATSAVDFPAARPRRTSTSLAVSGGLARSSAKINPPRVGASTTSLVPLLSTRRGWSRDCDASQSPMRAGSRPPTLAEPGREKPLRRGRRVLDDVAASKNDEATRVAFLGGIDRGPESSEAATAPCVPHEGSGVRPERVADQPVARGEVALVPVENEHAGGEVAGPHSYVKAVDDPEEPRPRRRLEPRPGWLIEAIRPSDDVALGSPTGEVGRLPIGARGRREARLVRARNVREHCSMAQVHLGVGREVALADGREPVEQIRGEGLRALRPPARPRRTPADAPHPLVVVAPLSRRDSHKCVFTQARQPRTLVLGTVFERRKQ